MAKRKIVTGNDPVLRKVCRPVDKITPRIKQLLAGVLRRVIVVETEPGQTYMLVNPEITESSGEQVGDEGCLSLPGESGCVRRPMKVKVRALGTDGKEVEIEGEGLLARAFCHEIDHLDGILYPDRAEYMNEKA